MTYKNKIKKVLLAVVVAGIGLISPITQVQAATTIMDGSADLLVGTARDEIEAAIAIAKTSLGVTDYVWGGAHVDDYTKLNFPYIDTDCSGFIRAAYVRGAGIEFGQGTTYTFKDEVFKKYNKPLEEAQRGDLIMSYDDSHISIYLGNGLQIESTGFGGGDLAMGDRLKNGGILIQPIASKHNIGSVLDMNLFLENEEGKGYKRVAPQDIMYTGQVKVPTLATRLTDFIESETLPESLALNNELPKEREIRVYREKIEREYVLEMIKRNNKDFDEGTLKTVETDTESLKEQELAVDGSVVVANIGERIRDIEAGRPVAEVDSKLVNKIVDEALESVKTNQPIPVNPNTKKVEQQEGDENWVIL